jgi:hypothetical protein
MAAKPDGPWANLEQIEANWRLRERRISAIFRSEEIGQQD